MTNNTNPATEKQLSFLRSLCAERGLDLNNTDRPYGTVAEASALISFVMSLPRAPRAQAAPVAAAQPAPRAPRTVQVTEPGIYYRGGEVYRVKKGRESGNLWAAKLRVIGGMRQTEAGAVVAFEYDYDKGAIFDLTPADRMTVEQAKELSLRYGACINCAASLKDAVSVELGIGPVCIKKFVGGAEALKVARAAARAALKAAGGGKAPAARRNPLADVSDERVAELEAEGMTHGDAVGVAMAEVLRARQEAA